MIVVTGLHSRNLEETREETLFSGFLDGSIHGLDEFRRSIRTQTQDYWRVVPTTHILGLSGILGLSSKAATPAAWSPTSSYVDRIRGKSHSQWRVIAFGTYLRAQLVYLGSRLFRAPKYHHHIPALRDEISSVSSSTGRPLLVVVLTIITTPCRSNHPPRPPTPGPWASPSPKKRASTKPAPTPSHPRSIFHLSTRSPPLG
ncbi:hypothetical protein B0H10DRAFT_2268611 [Mycena sp. CBHHK59/15]|nr:hypothetical protein B0H10DRAFT_2268611 [Mycena sp. CBHHK59/15]